MIRINLLPHRELKRAARQRVFNILAGAVFAAAVVIVLIVHVFIQSKIDLQNDRNNYLNDEIAKLDKQIQEINKLKEQKAVMLARKQVVEQLESNRSEVVRLFDQMVRQLPDGMYLSSIEQHGAKITLKGYAQSSARVSTLMRNLDASPWLENASLIEIKAANVNNTRLNEFAMTVDMKRPQLTQDDGKQSKGAKS